MMEPVNLENIYEELRKIKMTMVTRNELNRFIETVEILSNPETLNQIRNSEIDINSGNIREINSINDL